MDYTLTRITEYQLYIKPSHTLVVMDEGMHEWFISQDFADREKIVSLMYQAALQAKNDK